MLGRSVRRRIRLGLALIGAWRPTGAQLLGWLRSMVTSFVALGVTFVILRGRQSSGPGAVLLLVVVVAAVGLVLRPLLLGLAVLLGSFGLLVVGFAAQAAILAVAVSLAPDVHVHGLSTVVGAAWIAAAVAALVNWLLDAGSQDAYLAQVLGRVVRITHRRNVRSGATGGAPGLLIVQLDGVGAGLLHQAVIAGAVPTLSRWQHHGGYTAYRWHTGLPATTPAGQAVLLYGDRRQIPSFRWFEKDAGRLLVANRPADAADIERRLSTGRGLLADGGVSVSNLFSGDAATRILTMSDARLPPRSTRGLASFAAGSLGFVRTLVVFVGQVIEETYQARRQRRRDVQPRVARGGVFALLRGVTTAWLHDLNVAIVAEQMARGAPVIYVDFVDYDEIAHHAGPSRPEAMRTLDALDRVLLFLEQVAGETSRRYEIVVVSDHGQSQGAPFRQLAGQSLAEFVAAAAGRRPDAVAAGDGAAADAAVERWGPANVLLTSAARSGRPGLAGLARRKAEHRPGVDGADEMAVSLGDRALTHRRLAPRPPDAPATGSGPPPPLVVSAGSLAHIYLPELPGRATRAEVDARHPGLVAALVAHPAVGAVLVRDAEGPLLAGPDGDLRLDAAVGALAAYGPRAAADLHDLERREHVGDIVLLGRYDRRSGELAAFEELVGSHGGLGGDQTEAVLLVPSGWPRLGGGPGAVLTGSEVHAALVERLIELGLRHRVPTAEPVPAKVTP